MPLQPPLAAVSSSRHAERTNFKPNTARDPLAAREPPISRTPASMARSVARSPLEFQRSQGERDTAEVDLHDAIRISQRSLNGKEAHTRSTLTTLGHDSAPDLSLLGGRAPGKAQGGKHFSNPFGSERSYKSPFVDYAQTDAYALRRLEGAPAKKTQSSSTWLPPLSGSMNASESDKLVEYLDSVRLHHQEPHKAKPANAPGPLPYDLNMKTGRQMLTNDVAVAVTDTGRPRRAAAPIFGDTQVPLGRASSISTFSTEHGNSRSALTPSSQQSVQNGWGQSQHAQQQMQRAQDTSSHSGTYTCTYHGCSLRFDSPAKLQKHKREDHRRLLRNDNTSGSASPNLQLRNPGYREPLSQQTLPSILPDQQSDRNQHQGLQDTTSTRTAEEPIGLMNVHHTLSEDRCGDQETVMAQRLAALRSRHRDTVFSEGQDTFHNPGDRRPRTTRKENKMYDDEILESAEMSRFLEAERENATEQMLKTKLNKPKQSIPGLLGRSPSSRLEGLSLSNPQPGFQESSHSQNSMDWIDRFDPRLQSGRTEQRGMRTSSQAGGYSIVAPASKRSYPASWGMSTEPLHEQKRVLTVYDGDKRMRYDRGKGQWKVGQTLGDNFDGKTLVSGKDWGTDLDIETLKRAKVFHAAAEGEHQAP